MKVYDPVRELLVDYVSNTSTLTVVEHFPHAASPDKTESLIDTSMVEPTFIQSSL